MWWWVKAEKDGREWRFDEPVLKAYRFRHEILQAVQQQRGPAGIRKTSVYLVGAPLGRSPSASRPRPDAVPDPTGQAMQTQVFAKIRAEANIVA